MLPFIYEHFFIFSKVSFIGDVVLNVRSLCVSRESDNFKAGIAANGTYRGLCF